MWPKPSTPCWTIRRREVFVSLKVMVVLPTYNESENIREIAAALFALGIPDFHLLIVDDNSPDGTGDMAEDLARQADYQGKISVLHRPQKLGLGPAYKQGFRRALSLGADIIIQMDADFSHQPQYIPQMLEQAKRHDIVLGSRYVKGGSVDEGWGFLRKWLSWWANRVYTPGILNIPIKDATGGFRLLHRDSLLGMNIDQVKANGYVFQVEMIFVAHRLGCDIKEIPIHFPDRLRGTSKMSILIALEAALHVWKIKFRHRRFRSNNS